MNTRDLSPDQWAVLGSLFFLAAIALCALGIYYEYQRGRR